MLPTITTSLWYFVAKPFGNVANQRPSLMEVATMLICINLARLVPYKILLFNEYCNVMLV